MKSSLLPLLGFGLLAVLVQFVPPIMMGLVLAALGKTNEMTVNIIAMPLQAIVHAMATMGLINIALTYLDGRTAQPGDFFSPMPQILNYLVGMILYNAIVFVGIMLLIVPGIIWALQFQFVQYFIVDQQCGPIQALRRSSAITSGAKWNLLGFNVVLILIVLGGLMCLIVGVIPASIVAFLALTSVYRQLLSNTDKAALP